MSNNENKEGDSYDCSAAVTRSRRARCELGDGATRSPLFSEGLRDSIVALRAGMRVASERVAPAVSAGRAPGGRSREERLRRCSPNERRTGPAFSLSLIHI